MAILNIDGAEENSVTTALSFDTEGGTAPTIVTGYNNTGYAFQFSTSALTATAISELYSANTAGVKFYRSFMLRVVTLPAVTINICNLENSGGGQHASIGLTSTGTLGVYAGALVTQIGSSSSALQLNTWYSILFTVDGTATKDVVSLYINGHLVATGTGNANSTGWQRVQTGIQTVSTATIQIDNIVDWDNQGSGMNSLITTPFYLTRMAPNAAGDSNTFATQVGGTSGSANNYTRVNETTPDGATSYNGCTAANQQDLFKCSNPNLPLNATVQAVCLFMQSAVSSASNVTTAVKYQIESQSGGTLASSTSVILVGTSYSQNASNNTTYNAAASNTLPILSQYVDPQTSAAWLTKTLNSGNIQIGYQCTAYATYSMRISNIFAYVVYNLPIDSFIPFI